MKTSIIMAIIVLGVFVRPQSALSVHEEHGQNSSAVTVAPSHASDARPLTSVQMNTELGSGVADCYGYVGPNGDTYGTCCLDLWLFAICVTVNESALSRFINSL